MASDSSAPSGLLASHFDFFLPEAQIAQCSITPRDHSRLMVLNTTEQSISHSRFDSIIDHLRGGDLLVWNNSRVFKARLLGTLLRRTGNSWESKREMEIFLVRPVAPTSSWRTLGKPTRRMHLGDRVVFGDNFFCELLTKEESGELIVNFYAGDAKTTELGPVLDAPAVRASANAVGHIPIPPYVQGWARKCDFCLGYHRPRTSIIHMYH